MRLLSNADVGQVLTMASIISVLEDAYRQVFRGGAVRRPRIDVQVATGTAGARYNWSGLLDEEARHQVDMALRFGVSPAPVGLPQWRVTGDSIVYAAGHTGGPPGASAPGGTPVRRRLRPIPRRPRDLARGSVGRRTRGGRRSPADITYSERGGLRGIQFVSVAAHVYELASREGLGRELPPEWFLHDIRN